MLWIKGDEYMVLAICDDDVVFLERIKKIVLDSKLVANYGEKVHLRFYSHKRAIIEQYVEDKINAVFMDIEFGSDIGFDVAKELLLMDPNLLIVYMSNYDHYVYQSFVCRPMGFVRKFNMEQDITVALTQVINEIREQNKVLSLPQKGGSYDVKLSEIQSLEMQNHQMEIVMIQESIRVKASLNKIEAFLIECGFIKVRRGVIVNPVFVTNINQEGILEMINGRKYPISREQLVMVRRQWLLSRAR